MGHPVAGGSVNLLDGGGAVLDSAETDWDGGGNGNLCRRFAITAPAAGQLDGTVSWTTAAPFDGTVLRPDGSIAAYVSAPGPPMRLTVRVEAGLTYQVDVVHIDPSSREFD
jgi:hypothetical protein